MFNLPQGYIAQVLWHRQIGVCSYEFDRAYDPDGHLDRERSFWLLIPLNQGEHPVMRQLFYGEFKTECGHSDRSFEEFSSPSWTIEKWFGCGHALPSAA